LRLRASRSGDLRLVGENSEAQFQSRTHFFAAAAEAMRQILIDRARRKQASGCPSCFG